MRGPRRLYWVEVIDRGQLKYGKRGGGKYTLLTEAVKQMELLARQGIKSELYTTGDLDWQKMEVGKP